MEGFFFMKKTQIICQQFSIFSSEFFFFFVTTPYNHFWKIYLLLKIMLLFCDIVFHQEKNELLNYKNIYFFVTKYFVIKVVGFFLFFW